MQTHLAWEDRPEMLERSVPFTSLVLLHKGKMTPGCSHQSPLTPRMTTTCSVSHCPQHRRSADPHRSAGSVYGREALRFELGLVLSSPFPRPPCTLEPLPGLWEEKLHPQPGLLEGPSAPPHPSQATRLPGRSR